MVLVTVGEENSFYLSLVFQEVSDVRDNVVDPKHFVFGELQASIDDHDFIAVLIDKHVLAYLTHTTQGN
ncbi:MAG: hypothetical protein DDT39_00862 [Firmicutes bacterium]|nr:hypothetical protein [candidate division NPL-UPA2 bacterium]